MVIGQQALWPTKCVLVDATITIAWTALAVKLKCLVISLAIVASEIVMTIYYHN